ncbi:uncharacterized protein LOC130663192 [Microplitis mediator]|uniref:uncharacterized protein LOC130663192 n=1 Tax=Microplitis mediator TaxID=375433 RepID=UPI0025524967|nr:uncharacterized protein LOC130663192 [Microplitis mediator]
MDNDHQVTFESLKVLADNVNSIIHNRKRYEIQLILDTNHYDILLLSETKLNPNHSLEFKNYNIIRTDRPNAIQGGGTAILIKKSLNYQTVYHPSSSLNEVLEYTIVSLSLKKANLLIISAYATNDNHSIFIDELNNLLLNIKTSDPMNYFLLAGDLNIKNRDWGDSEDNQRGKIFKNWASDKATEFKASIYSPIRPTFKPGRSFLDICIADARLTLTNTINGKLETLEYDSDHDAIIMEIATDVESQRPLDLLAFYHRYRYKSTKWKSFTKKLDTENTTIIPSNVTLSTDQIDNYLKEIDEAILKTIEVTVPKVKPHDKIYNYVNSNIKKLYKEKTRLLTLYHNQLRIDPTHKRKDTIDTKAELKIIKNNSTMSL